MLHRGTMTLMTDTLYLRRFVADDTEPLFRNLFSDAEAMRFLQWNVHTKIDETGALLSCFIDGYMKTDYYVWAIILKDSTEPIGFVDTTVDESISAIKIDFGIGKQWWRKGYSSNALSAVIRFFFEKIGVNRLYATHDPRNPNSGAVMKKCGMKYEGTLRQARCRKGEYSDRVMYSILIEDYSKME